MRDLTLHEIDDQLAEQLPSRELMGSSCCRSSSSGFTYNQGNGNGNDNWTVQNGAINVSANGNGNGNNIVLGGLLRD
jgi:hypothetical protein